MFATDMSQRVNMVQDIVEAISTPVDDRTTVQTKVLKAYVHTDIPLMESLFCTNDDYTYLAEHLKFKRVEKGHYVVKQGDPGSQCFFII